MRCRGLLARIIGVGAMVAFAASSAGATSTPIQNLVVIFQENVSFDHYFGTYPNATNPSGEPAFTPAPGTPSVNGLSPILLTSNPNKFNVLNGAGAANPFRLDRDEAGTSDQNHAYGAEQLAYDSGLLDLFPLEVGTAGPPPSGSGTVTTKGLVMGYYDGNTVTALWNYAQRFALSDNHFGSTFGPSTPGALNVISGQTNGVTTVLNPSSSFEVPDGSGGLTLINDADPVGDVCSTPTRNQAQMGGKNIGDLLNAAGISWGSFMGGFDLTVTNSNGTTGCKRSSTSSVTGTTGDYIPHHAWFQYYSSTANPTHARPGSVSEIGHSGAANHEYDINDFFTAVEAGEMPAVSYLKAPAFEDGHAGYSDPLDEQTFLVDTINFLQKRKEWKNMAIVITWDDSDGWYDHQMPPIVNQSVTSADGLTGTGACGTGGNSLPGTATATAHAQGRCGFGPRIPLLVISPWAKQNYVEHSTLNFASVVRFIEDNWLNGQRIQGSFDAVSGPINNMFDFTPHNRNLKKLILSDSTGEPGK